MKKVKEIFKTIIDKILFVFGLDSKTRRDAVDEGLIDMSGQGKDKYGK